MKKRINTDLFMSIALYNYDSTALDLSDTSDMNLLIVNTDYPSDPIMLTVSYVSNIITFLYLSEQNNCLGTFDGTLSYKRNYEPSFTGYIQVKIDFPSMFTIVPSTSDEDTVGQRLSYVFPIGNYEQDITRLLGEIDTNSSLITLNANEISTKVSLEAFSSLNQVVISNQSLLTQTATDVSSKVSSTDYNGATIASLINQSADSVVISALHIALSGAITFENMSLDVINTISGYSVTALLNAEGYTDSKISALGKLSKLDSIAFGSDYITGLGTLAGLSYVSTSNLDNTLSNMISTASSNASTSISGVNVLSTNLSNLLGSLKSLAYKDNITTSLITDLGALAKLDSVGLANLNATVVSGGKILTSLIVANEILTNALAAGTIVAGNATIDGLTVANATITGNMTVSGVLTCTNATWNYGTYSNIVVNNITSTSGIIGGFVLGPSSLTSSYTGYVNGGGLSCTNHITLTAECITFNDTYNSLSSIVGTTNNVSGSLDMLTANTINIGSSPYYKPHCSIGLYILVTGADTSDSDSNVLEGNHALMIPLGNICGFRLRGRRLISGNYTLTVMDSYIVCAQATNGALSITLPSNCEDMLLFYIRNTNYDTIITSSSGTTFSDGDRNTGSSTYVLHYGHLGFFLYDETNSVWWCNQTEH